MGPQILSNPAYIKYCNENVLFRFSNMYDMLEEDIHDLFQETKKFIAICTEPNIYINDDMLIIDEMWHNFILFTPVYAEFCQQFFGRFIHHIPMAKKEREKFTKLRLEDPDKAKDEYLQREELLMSTVYEFCGEDTVKKWFSDYPQKYTKEYIKSMQK